MQPDRPSLRFLSLFVPDLTDAARRYEAMLGVAPSSPTEPAGSSSAARPPAPAPHPCASAGPVIFELGDTCLALYQCDGRTTHPGDVGIGLRCASPSALARRASVQGGKVFLGPAPLPTDGRECAVLVMPDRHFFEVLASDPPP